MKQLTKFYNLIASIGISNDMQIEDAQRVRLVNLLGILPLTVYIYFIYFGYANAYYFPMVICTFLLLFVSLGIFCNYKKKHSLAKAILLSANSIVVFATYNCLNIDYSIVTYFFPLLIAYEIVFDARKELKIFAPTLLFTILCGIACFTLPKYLVYEYHMTAELLQTSIVLNYIYPLILSLLFIFIIIKVHGQTQDKLIDARVEAEMANKSKSDFLSNMSHELRTPLNGIIGATNLLMHEPASASQTKYYEVLEHTSDHMLNLINQILDFSKIKEKKIHLDRNVFNMRDILAKLCRVYKAQNTHEHVLFNFEIDEALNKDVISDDLRINQILLNLLSNAFKFTKRGTVNLSAKIIEEVENNIRIQFKVSDTGVGIKQSQIAKIFESFEQADSSTTRNFGGTGLGLSISKQLVTLFDSTLVVESIEGKGSTFSFEITAEIDKTLNKAEGGDEIKKSLQGIKILVAEDNKVNMMVLLTFLKKWNVSYTDVPNGLEAVKKYQHNDYDLVLMDLEMPEMDGYTAIREIRKQDNNTPVIAFTAALYDGMATDLKTKGFDGFLHKPFNPIDLYNKILKYTLN
jgi:signal transduction histidine kinase/CheY-like chemotaxis protein